MTEFNIRIASPSDAPDLAKLRYGLRSRGKLAMSTDRSQEKLQNLAKESVSETPSNPRYDLESETEFLERCTDWMCKALQQSHWRCWVAEQNGSLIGALWLQVIEKIPNPSAESESYGYITNFFVNEEARRQGIGSAVLEETLKWCREHAFHTVILWPTEKSRSLYVRYGFKVTPDLFERVGTPKE